MVFSHCRRLKDPVRFLQACSKATQFQIADLEALRDLQVGEDERGQPDSSQKSSKSSGKAGKLKPTQSLPAESSGNAAKLEESLPSSAKASQLTKSFVPKAPGTPPRRTRTADLEVPATPDSQATTQVLGQEADAASPVPASKAGIKKAWGQATEDSSFKKPAACLRKPAASMKNQKARTLFNVETLHNSVCNIGSCPRTAHP